MRLLNSSRIQRVAGPSSRNVALAPVHSQHVTTARRQVLNSLLLAGSISFVPQCNSVASSEVAVEAQAVVEKSAPEFTDGLCLDGNPPTYVTANGRIVAIGDLHGDMRKTLRSMQLAGVLALEGDRAVWIGKDTVLVQLGDVMDRGDYEIGIVMLLRDMDNQARKVGGAVYMLNGNHESLNICGDYRYVTEGAFLESSTASGLTPKEAANMGLARQARMALYAPGGPMAMELSKNPTVLIVNDTAFAHGGLLPMHVRYGIEKMNLEMAAWMRADQLPDGAKAMPPYLAMGDGKSVMWNRTLSREQFGTANEKYTACNACGQALDAINAKRLVVGHTPQLSGANCECNGKVWRIDVGMSSGVLDANVQILEIIKIPGSVEVETRILTEGSLMSTWSDDALDSYDME